MFNNLVYILRFSLCHNLFFCAQSELESLKEEHDVVKVFAVVHV